jgi:Fe-S oxidoreductase
MSSGRLSARKISSKCIPTAPTTIAAAAVVDFSSPATRRRGGAYGQCKTDQILDTKADYCITPCHNCHAQVHDLAEQNEHAWQTVHLWTLICLSLGVLGPNEREYLGDDLKEVDVFHPESAM